MARALLLLLLLAGPAGSQLTEIGVVDSSPERARLLAAAVDAALQGGGGGKAYVAPAEPGEPLDLATQVCVAAAKGTIAALVMAAEADAGAAGLAEAAAARAGLPLLLAAPAPRLLAAREALALYPHEDALTEAGYALVEAKGWQSAVLLHEGPPRVAPRLAPPGVAIVARALPPAADREQLRNLLLVLKASGARNFIAWGSSAACARVLTAAARAGLRDQRHSYLLLALDAHALPLAQHSHAAANITTLRMFDPESEYVKKLKHEWRRQHERALPLGVLTTPMVLAHDAARYVATALHHLQLPPAWRAPAARDSCASGAGGLHADTLLNYLRSEEWDGGVGGVARWDGDGARRDVALQVAELERGGRLTGVGAWSRAGLDWQRPLHPSPPARPDSMTNRTFNILIAKNNPYVMRQESTERLSGNARYEGFCVELVERLAEQLGFNFTLLEQADGAYGSFDNRTGQWSGMMHRLMNDDNIHFAITDLTITAEREQAVDFTTPFMNLGISILFRKPEAPQPEIFAFLLPFSKGVWVCLGVAYVATSLVLWALGRLSPAEWQNPYPCVEEPPALENQFTLANALWFNLGAVLLQGSEIAPVAYGTRAAASVWWVFALVITSSYTANLATLLAQKSSSELIHGAEDLRGNQLGITYGAKAGGSTYTFFEHSQNPVYQDMYRAMKTQTMPATNEEGIEKVMNGSYAFLAESTTIEYTTQRNCAVVQVGKLLDSKGYGLAMKKSSPYRQALNLALLNLQERGVLREMKHRWWSEKHGGGACEKDQDHNSEELTMRNFLGLFLVLSVGSALGVAVSFADLALGAARRRRAAPPSQRLTYWRQLLRELRFVFQFERSVKPVVPEPPTPSPSPPASPLASPMSSPAASPPGSPAASPRERSPAAAGGTRTSSMRSRRRRSSIHAASMRLARHAAAGDH